MKELAEEFKKQFTRENTEKYKTFTVSIEKEVTRINKNEKEICKKYIYDSARFMASSLSNLVNNLSEGIRRIKAIRRTTCKYKLYDKNVKLVELNISIVTDFLKAQILKMI